VGLAVADLYLIIFPPFVLSFIAVRYFLKFINVFLFS